jgi:hypothetical protein
MPNEAEEKLRAATRASKAIDREQIEMTEASRQVLVGMLRDEMQQAVADGIRSAMTDDTAREFVGILLDEMRSQATTKVDVWAGGVLRVLLSRVALFLLAGSIVYSVGGWGALAGLFKWMSGGKP